MKGNFHACFMSVCFSADADGERALSARSGAGVCAAPRRLTEGAREHSCHQTPDGHGVSKFVCRNV